MLEALNTIRAELMNRNARHLGTYERVGDGRGGEPVIEVWAVGGKIVYVHQYADDAGYDVAYPTPLGRNDEVLAELVKHMDED